MDTYRISYSITIHPYHIKDNMLVNQEKYLLFFGRIVQNTLFVW